MDLLEQIKQAGIIGAGGAGFPTHAKLNTTAEYLLMNGAECEPLLRVDQQLMNVYTDEIILGFVKASQHLQAKEAIIGIKGKHKELLNKLNERLVALNVGHLVRTHALPDAYPMGDEQVLVYELTGRVVPEVGIPINVGCVVVNSETALNIYRASQGVAVTETWVTLAGDIPERKTFKVLVGTPIIDVLKCSGIDDFSDYAVIDGGPMMGAVMTRLDGFIAKKNKGFIILKKSHPLIARKLPTMKQAKRVNRGACEQCRMCTDICPRYLLGHNMQPHRIMIAMNYETDDIENQKIAQLCCQCGLCELFSCPAGLFPKTANMVYKAKLVQQNLRYERKTDVFSARPQRKYRLVPSKRLIARLMLSDYDKPAPLSEVDLQPEMVKISMRQHIGAPSVPVVAEGDRVECGQLIGKIAENALGATAHASMSGQVEEVSKDFVVIRRV